MEHVKTPDVALGKLDNRSVDMVYIGKEPGTKGHRLYNPSTGRLHVSRDVVFEEEKGLNWEHKETQDNGPPGTFIIFDTQTNNVQNDIETEMHTPRVPSTGGSSVHEPNSEGYNSQSSGESSEPRRFRLLNEIYEDTEEVEIADELLFIGVEEPKTFEEAKFNKEWNEL